MTALVYIEIEARRAAVDLRINDIPAWRGAGAERQGAGVCLNGLLHGQDRLEIRGAWAREGDQPGEGLLSINVGAYEAGDVVGVDAEPFFEDRLTDTGPDPRISYSTPLNPPLSARWQWMDAPPVVSTDPGAVAFALQLAEAFRRGDADTLFAAMAPVFADRQTAFPEDTVEDFRERLTRGFAEPAIDGTPPLDPAQLVLRPAADGRLLEVIDRNGDPFLLKRVRGGDIYPLPVLIGRHGPDWVIFR